jgi:predicted HAD superfamily Cof-like phosphohydrolase
MFTPCFGRAFSFSINMGQLQEHARQWRKAFEVESDNQRGSLQYNLQIKLIIEEYTEVIEAFDAFKQSDTSTHSDLLKELSDLVFVCYQAAENMGWDLDEAMQRIFDSNMSKLDDSGKPVRNETGKVMKGPNYQKPDLMNLVRKAALLHQDDGR